jgi:hypothetical protein
MLKFDNITIVSVNSRDPENSIKAIERSCKYIKFKKALLISNQKFDHEFIETSLIKPLSSIPHYNRFMVKSLNDFIDTDFCLVVQPDGYVINPLMWLNEFLNYDYIGAPWDLSHSHNAIAHCPEDLSHLKKVPIVVGNGGFSLRSKRLLEECSKIELDGSVNEDVFICSVVRKHLINCGIKFAPVILANRFSFECPIYMDEKLVHLDAHFGFHGTHSYKKDVLDLLNNFNEDIPSIKLAKKMFSNV